MADVGLTFSPLSQPTGAGSGSRYGASPALQEAIQLLSLRLPTQGLANAPAGPSLLGSPTALGSRLGGALPQQALQGQPTNDFLQQLMSMLGPMGGPSPARVQFQPGFSPGALGGLGSPPVMPSPMSPMGPMGGGVCPMGPEFNGGA